MPSLEQAYRNAGYSCPTDQSRARTFIKALGSHRQAQNITKAQIEKFHKTRGHSSSTRNRYGPTLRKLGVETQRVHEDQAVRRVLSDRELSALDDRVRQHPDKYCQCMYAILRETGCRGRAELERVTREDIDFENRTIRFTSHKGRNKRTRLVPLSDVAMKAVSWWVHQGLRLPGEGRFRTFWNEVRPDRRTKPYALRHTFATRLLDRDVPLAVAQAIMGHTNPTQTAHYYHLRQSAMDAARTALSHEIL